VEASGGAGPRLGIGRERQSEIYVRGIRGNRPRVPVDMTRLE